MPGRLDALASAWRQFWSRESLPSLGLPADRSGRTVPVAWVRRLLSREQLAHLEPAADSMPARSLLRALWAREALPPPADAAVTPRRSGSFLKFILAPESLPPAGAVTPKAKSE